MKAQAVEGKSKLVSSIFIDGLNERERERVAKGLRRLAARRILFDKVRGLRDESSALIRLADALAGFIRDWEEGQPYTEKLFPKFLKKGLIKAVRPLTGHEKKEG